MPKLKIDVLPHRLKEAARRVSSIPAPSSPVDWYHYLSLISTPDKDSVRIFATNGVAAAIAIVPEAVKSGSGQIVMHAQQFMSIVNGLDTAATFAISDTDKITMESAGWKCKLPFIDAKLQSPSLQGGHTITLRIEPLLYAVECAMSAVGKGVVLGYDVDSVIFDFKDHTKPRIVSADSKQMVVVNLPTVSQEPHAGQTLKIPVPAAKAFLSFFQGQEGLIKIRYGENHACAWNDLGVIYMLLASGNTIPVDKVIESSSRTASSRVIVPKLTLLRAIKRAAVTLKGNESKRLDLLLNAGMLTLKCEDEATGESTSDVECDNDDTDGKIRGVCIDFQALESAVNKINSDSIVMLIGDEDSPIRLDCSPVWWTIAPFVKETSDGKEV